MVHGGRAAETIRRGAPAPQGLAAPGPCAPATHRPLQPRSDSPASRSVRACASILLACATSLLLLDVAENFIVPGVVDKRWPDFEFLASWHRRCSAASSRRCISQQTPLRAGPCERALHQPLAL